MDRDPERVEGKPLNAGDRGWRGIIGNQVCQLTSRKDQPYRSLQSRDSNLQRNKQTKDAHRWRIYMFAQQTIVQKCF